MNLSQAIRECVSDLLATEPQVEIEQVVDCVNVRYPGVVADEAERLVEGATRRAVKDHLRGLADDDEDPAQLSLPGLSLPSAIAVPNGHGSYVYVRTDKAVWPQLVAGREVRVSNVDRAVSKLDMYDEALDSLRPVMESDPSVTAAEAARRLAIR